MRLTSTYGYDLKEQDPYMPVVKKAIDALVTSQGIGFMVDKLPICELLSHLFAVEDCPIWLNLVVRYGSFPWIRVNIIWPVFNNFFVVPAWFPGARFKRFANEGKKYCTEILEGPFKNTKNHWVRNELEYYVSFTHRYTISWSSPGMLQPVT